MRKRLGHGRGGWRRYVWAAVAVLCIGVLQPLLSAAMEAPATAPDGALDTVAATQAELQSALDRAVYGTTITVAGSMRLTAPLTVAKNNVAVKLRSAGGAITLTAAGSRHFRCSGNNIDLVFEGIVLDGGGTGGGIFSNVAGLSLTGAVIQNCYSAGSGGGIEAAAGSLQIEDGTVIRGNRAAAYGGGISTGAATSLQIDGGEIADNTAAAYGGGVFVGVAGKLRMDGGSVRGNRAVQGGGLYCGLSGNVLLDGGDITGNTASGSTQDAGKGGGIFAVTSDILLDGVTITGNQAHDGGGVYATGDGSDIVLGSGRISGNRAVGADAYGGGVFLDTAYSTPNTVTVNGGALEGNEAVRGGGIFAGGAQPPLGTSSPGSRIPASVTVNGGTVGGNAAGLGGGIFADKGAGIYVGGGAVRGNTAADGGGIWTVPLDSLTVAWEAVFRDNTADTAVYYPTDDDIQLHGRQIQTTQFSGGFSYAYNNWDVVYDGGEVAHTHTVALDYMDADNQGEHPEKITVQHGQPVGALPQPARRGYRFAGWYSETAGGDKWTSQTVVTRDLTLYARWTPNTYTIYFDYGDAEPASPALMEKDVVFGEMVGYLPLAVKSPTDAFVGWADSGDTLYYPATVYEEAGDITLVAVWDHLEVVHRVRFDGGGAQADTAPDRLIRHGEVVGTLPKPARPGFALVGWFDDDGSPDAYRASTRIYDRVELTARWDPVPWVVTFEYDGADSGERPPGREVGHDQPIGALPAPRRTGHLLEGWYTEPNGDGSRVESGWPVTADSTLYAHWEPDTYYLHFDYQGAGISMEDKKQVFFGRKIGMLPLPAKTGHHFVGWYTQPGDAGRYIGGGTSGYAYDRTEDATVFAGWQGDPYTVTFDYQGADGDNPLQRKQVLFGDNLGYLPFPERSGHRFAGWFTGKAGMGQQVFVGTEYNVPGNVTLYAYWLPDSGETPSYGEGDGKIPGRRVGSDATARLDPFPAEGEAGWDNPATGRVSAAPWWGLPALLSLLAFGALCWIRNNQSL